MLAVLGVLIIPAIVALAITLLGRDEVESPQLVLERKITRPPEPEDTVLRLIATDVDSGVGDDEVTDVQVDEGTAEIAIDASLRIDNQFGCEIRTAHEPFTVHLSEPLGQRLIVDDSRGAGTVIWSPQIRNEILRRQRLDSSDAKALIRSKLPAAQDTSCSGNRGKYFACTVRVPSRDKPVSIYVWIGPGARLKVAAGEKLPPELRTCSPEAAFRVC